MKIIADENMLQVVEMFSPVGEVTTLPGRGIGPEDIRDADVLLVRSVTKVDQALLEGSKVKFVGTATIGLDHIDQTYLTQRGIQLAYAPGCNAGAVVQYVFSVLANCRPDWRQSTIGIIGCGNVGGRLNRQLTELGVATRCYDPFLSVEENPRLTDLQQVLDTDVICLHTPLTKSGPYPTWHLLSEAELASLKPGTTIINAGRGEAVNNQVLSEAIDTLQLNVALDVWEGEPDISLELLSKVKVATPHIAGYSRDGKLAGTQMVYDAFCQWVGLPTRQEEGEAELLGRLNTTDLNQAVLRAYNVMDDDSRMREAFGNSSSGTRRNFDRLRKHYPQRQEFSHFTIEGELSVQLRNSLAVLGFTV